MFMGFLATPQLMHLLKMKSKDAITWLSENQVIVISDESKVIAISKKSWIKVRIKYWLET